MATCQPTLFFFTQLFCNSTCNVILCLLQLKNGIDKRNTEIRKLERRINEIVDRIYRDFSKSVGVANIREYEENQLKAVQHMADERVSLSSQLSKLKCQQVLLFFTLVLPCLAYLWFYVEENKTHAQCSCSLYIVSGLILNMGLISQVADQGIQNSSFQNIVILGKILL